MSRTKRNYQVPVEKANEIIETITNKLLHPTPEDAENFKLYMTVFITLSELKLISPADQMQVITQAYATHYKQS